MPQAIENTRQRLRHIVQQSLPLPLLDYFALAQFRQQLAQGLRNYSTVYNSVFLGMQSATPGMAFLSGYQNALRCLDATCPDTQLAAFCVSEKGVKKPWDMATRITTSSVGHLINGQKGYVMLLPDDLDRLYVVVKDQAEQLRCVYFQSTVAGLTLTEPLRAPFIEDIPHSGVSFDHILIASEQLMPIDGHSEANKPFRYWEDVHVTLAMMAWMFRYLDKLHDLNKLHAREQEKAKEIRSGENTANHKDQLIEQMAQLINQFESSPNYYCAASFTMLDTCQALLEHCSTMLFPKQQKQWQKDRLLLQMGQKIRCLIQVKMQS